MTTSTRKTLASVTAAAALVIGAQTSDAQCLPWSATNTRGLVTDVVDFNIPFAINPGATDVHGANLAGKLYFVKAGDQTYRVAAIPQRTIKDGDSVATTFDQHYAANCTPTELGPQDLVERMTTLNPSYNAYRKAPFAYTALPHANGIARTIEKIEPVAPVHKNHN